MIMATDIFSGDPYLIITLNGSRLTYVGGQPRMDQGLENQALIALFTDKGWAGNYLFDDLNQQIGSDFIKAANQPPTLQTLTDVEQAAVGALQSPSFGRVTAEANNPESDRIEVRILIEPPGQDTQEIILSRNGINWQAQANNPAHEKI
jgi:phage gp46-like protein